MAQLLVSVRTTEEAREAMRGGASIIDVKEPDHGPLGCAAPEQLTAIRQVVEPAIMLSAACGELLEQSAGEAWERVGRALRGFQLAKVGLAGCAATSDWGMRWRNFRSRLPAGVTLVAVVYADWRRARAPAPAEVIEQAGNAACPWLLVDTYDKSTGHLFEQVGDEQLGEWVGAARQRGMSIALAGSLTPAVLSRGLGFQPDVLAVRGAACEGGRKGTVSASLVRQLVRSLDVAGVPVTSS
ncbi:MAG: (5-formylfuran-3-yl)methyl phosphate synthase [Pirellulaceae bacterium]